MRNVAANLNKRRIAFLKGRNSIVRSLGQADIELGRTKVVECCVPCFLHHQVFSTGFTSVHGERPSAEYARLRKESLENEFGHALGTYGSSSFSAYYRFGPFLALYRATIISFQVAKLTLWHFFLQDIRQRAIKFRETLIQLGPFYVKASHLGRLLALDLIYCLKFTAKSLQSYRIKFLHFLLGLRSSQLSRNWVLQFHKYLLISALNQLQQHPWGRCTKQGCTLGRL